MKEFSEWKPRKVVNFATKDAPLNGWHRLYRQLKLQKNALKNALVVDTITTRFLMLFLFLLSIPLVSVILFTVSLLSNRIEEGNALQLTLSQNSIAAQLDGAHQQLDLLERIGLTQRNSSLPLSQLCHQWQLGECLVVDPAHQRLLLNGQTSLRESLPDKAGAQPVIQQGGKPSPTRPNWPEGLADNLSTRPFYAEINRQIYLLQRSSIPLPGQQILYWGIPLNAAFFNQLYSQQPKLQAEIWLLADRPEANFSALLHLHNPAKSGEVSQISLWKQLRQTQEETDPAAAPADLPYLIQQEVLQDLSHQPMGRILYILPLNRNQQLLGKYYLGIYIIAVASLIFSVLLAMAAGRTITQPLLKLIRQVNQLSRETVNQEQPELLVGGVFEIQQLGQAFNRMLKRLRQEHKLRDEFVATLTHDLKVPLLAEKQTLAYMGQEIYGPLGEEQAEVVSVLQSSNRSCLSLVTGLLEVYRYDSGEVTLRFDSFSMEALLQEVVQEFQALAREKLINLEFQSALQSQSPKPDEAPPEADSDPLEANGMVYADRLEIKRVLGNLISNAIVNTAKHGGIHCKITNAENYGSDTIYKVSSFQYTSLKFPIKLTERLMVTVQDSGLGFSSEDLDALFKQFAANKSRNPMSIGLGLYNCHQVLKAHKGVVWVESTEGEGSLVSFILPQNKKAAQDRRIFRDRRRIPEN